MSVKNTSMKHTQVWKEEKKERGEEEKEEKGYKPSYINFFTLLPAL